MAAGRWEHVHEPSAYVMDAEGGNVRRLTADGQLAGSPKWSPDAKRIVFYELAVEDTFRACGLGGQTRVELPCRLAGRYVICAIRAHPAWGP